MSFEALLEFVATVASGLRTRRLSAHTCKSLSLDGRAESFQLPEAWASCQLGEPSRVEGVVDLLRDVSRPLGALVVYDAVGS